MGSGDALEGEARRGRVCALRVGHVEGRVVGLDKLDDLAEVPVDLLVECRHVRHEERHVEGAT